MKNNQNEYEISVHLGFIETVKAKNLNEAIKKLEDKYIHGKGRLPREYIHVEEYESYWCQVED